MKISNRSAVAGRLQEYIALSHSSYEYSTPEIQLSFFMKIYHRFLVILAFIIAEKFTERKTKMFTGFDKKKKLFKL